MQSKKPLQSTTVVAALSGGVLTIGLMYGVVQENEVEGITTLLVQLVPLLLQLFAFIGAVYGRIKAKSQISFK